MRERGSSEEEIKDRLELDEKVFRTIQADASIDTGDLTVEAVACRIYSLFLEAVRADKSEIRRKYLRLRLSDIDWDTGNGNATSKADASKLPKEIIVADRFLDRDYRNKTGRLDVWSLEAQHQTGCPMNMEFRIRVFTHKSFRRMITEENYENQREMENQSCIRTWEKF